MSWLAGYGKPDNDQNDNLGIDWVLQYDFSDIGRHTPNMVWVGSAHIDDWSSASAGNCRVSRLDR